VIREVAEETGLDAVVERLLGVDSRVIPVATARAGVAHQNVGIFHQVRITGGHVRPEPNGEIAESVWTSVPEVARLRRSSLVDVGIDLAQTVPATTSLPFRSVAWSSTEAPWGRPRPSAAVETLFQCRGQARQYQSSWPPSDSWAASGAGNGARNVNAHADGPCSLRCASLSSASATVGRWPSGTHHKTW
jgi:8-oxo-dGTP pyrophosphatase MutT (NUDIX family)